MTRKDVAQRAGVSVAVVSYVLNDVQKVGEATRKRVLQAIEDLDYHPNIAARSLKMRRTNQITVLLNDLENPFEAFILTDIEEAAATAGYSVQISKFQPQREEELKTQLTGRSDGIILIGQSLKDTTVSHFLKQKIPLLSIHKPVWDRKEIPYIDVDWVHAMRQLIRRLRDAGHESIGFMSNGQLSHHHTQRFQAFLQAMQFEKLFFHHSSVLYGGGNYEKAYQVMHEALRGQLPFSALICANDMMALGVLAACREAVVSVPGKLAVTGCENTVLAALTSPSLTSVDFPRRQLGALAVLMLKQAANGEQAGSITLEAELIARDSG